jgi:hypothetical protein
VLPDQQPVLPQTSCFTLLRQTRRQPSGKGETSRPRRPRQDRLLSGVLGVTATAANIPLGPNTLSGEGPWDTVERLAEADVLLYAMFWPTGEPGAAWRIR